MSACKCANGKILSSSIPARENKIVTAGSANFLGTLGGYHTLSPFRVWVQKVLPQVYDDSLSYQELIYKLMYYINTMIEDVNTTEENIEKLSSAYDDLEKFVNCYFSNLDLTGEVERLIDEMANDGTLFTYLIAHLIAGTGIVFDVVDSVDTDTETEVVSIENYPTCCGNCECCDGCSYANLSDGDVVTSVYETTGKKVTTTISRSGDEITTTVVTETDVKSMTISTDDEHICDVIRDLISSGDSTIDEHIEEVIRELITGGDTDIDNYLTEYVSNNYDIANHITVGVGLSKYAVDNVVKLYTSIGGDNYISVSPASNNGNSGKQTISLNTSNLLSLIQGWIDDGSLDTGSGTTSGGDGYVVYDGTDFDENYGTMYTTTVSSFPDVSNTEDTGTRDMFSLTNLGDYTRIVVTYNYTCYVNYGYAQLYLCDELVHSGMATALYEYLTDTYEINISESTTTYDITGRAYGVNESSEETWKCEAALVITGITLYYE